MLNNPFSNMDNTINFMFHNIAGVTHIKIKIYRLRTNADVVNLPPVYRSPSGRWVVSLALNPVPHGLTASRLYCEDIRPEIEALLRNHPNF